MSAPDPQDVPLGTCERDKTPHPFLGTEDDADERNACLFWKPLPPQDVPGDEMIWIRASKVSSLKAQLAAKDEELRLMTVNRDNWKSAARLADEAFDDAEEQRQKLEAQLAEAQEALRALVGENCPPEKIPDRVAKARAVLAKMEGR